MSFGKSSPRFFSIKAHELLDRSSFSELDTKKLHAIYCYLSASAVFVVPDDPTLICDEKWEIFRKFTSLSIPEDFGGISLEFSLSDDRRLELGISYADFCVVLKRIEEDRYLSFFVVARNPDSESWNFITFIRLNADDFYDRNAPVIPDGPLFKLDLGHDTDAEEHSEIISLATTSVVAFSLAYQCENVRITELPNTASKPYFQLVANNPFDRFLRPVSDGMPAILNDDEGNEDMIWVNQDVIDEMNRREDESEGDVDSQEPAESSVSEHEQN